MIMPLYDYRCSECELTFEEIVTVSKRDSVACPECGKKKCVTRSGVYETSMGVDMSVTPDKKTNGDFSRLMNKMKHGTPKRLHGQFDQAGNRNAGKLGPQ